MHGRDTIGHTARYGKYAHWIPYERLNIELRKRESLLRDSHDVTIRGQLLDWGGRVGAAGGSKLFVGVMTHPHLLQEDGRCDALIEIEADTSAYSRSFPYLYRIY